jgi:hypothetical protein
MSVLIATSTFTLLTPTGEDWGGEAAAYTDGDTVRGTLSGAAGVSDGAGNVIYQHKLTLDPCELTEDMRVRDESTGLEYSIVDVPQRTTLIPVTVAQVTRSVATS